MRNAGGKNTREAVSGPAARRMKRIGAKVARWFDGSQRNLPWRRGYEPYRVWVAEIMLQQTRVETVLPYYRRWLERFPDVRALASAREEAVLKAWEGLGYYSRARNLHQAARTIVAHHRGAVPDKVRDLESLPGIGRYTAGAIASIAYGRKVPAVDGNVGRVLSRLEALDLPVRSSTGGRRLWALASSLARQGNPRLVNEGLMELGALVCLPRNPRCAGCPLRRSCLGYRTGHPERFPPPPPRKARRLRRGVLLLARDSRGRMLFRKRPPRGLWGGLWEPPWEEWGRGEETGFSEGAGRQADARRALARKTAARKAAARQLAGLGLRGERWVHLGTLRHGLTHLELVLECFGVRVHRNGKEKKGGNGDGEDAPPGHKWATGEEAASLPLPRFGRRALEMREEGE